MSKTFKPIMPCGGELAMPTHGESVIVESTTGRLAKLLYLLVAPDGALVVRATFAEEPGDRYRLVVRPWTRKIVESGDDTLRTLLSDVTADLVFTDRSPTHIAGNFPLAHIAGSPLTGITLKLPIPETPSSEGALWVTLTFTVRDIAAGAEWP